MKKRNKIILSVIIILLIIISILAFNTNLTVTYYKIESEKIKDKIRIAFISDFHSCYYGKNQKDLVDCINIQNPDVILFGGDIFDADLPYDNTIIFLNSVSKQYPCYYVIGNHEIDTKDLSNIKNILQKNKITILSGDCIKVNLNEQIINICGIDDPKIGESKFKNQLEKINNSLDSSLYTIFLSHRPERISSFTKYNFDLILSGHAHGGQIRIPYILNGLFAPHQGIFPQYAGGHYKLNNTDFIVGRGLSKESSIIPRVFNPPELVIIDITS